MKQWHLKQHYVVVRHGESTANIENLVVTEPDIGCTKYGLTAKGRTQTKRAVVSIEKLIKKYDFALDNVHIYFSDFKRTKETADILCEDVLYGKKHQSIASKLLRERGFGELNKNDGNLTYETIWKLDKKDPDHTQYGVESVNHTLGRIKQFIKQIERKHVDSDDKKLIIMVAHGDVCQIMQTLFANVPSSFHHDLDYISNAEVRDLTAIINAVYRTSRL